MTVLKRASRIREALCSDAYTRLASQTVSWQTQNNQAYLNKEEYEANETNNKNPAQHVRGAGSYGRGNRGRVSAVMPRKMIAMHGFSKMVSLIHGS